MRHEACSRGGIAVPPRGGPSPGGAEAATVKKLTTRAQAERRLAVWYMAPALVILVALAIYPILNTFWMSLQRLILKFPNAGRWEGVGNYIRLLEDPKFVSAWKHTVLFTGVSVILETVLGLVIALIIVRNFRGRGLVRAAILIPWAIPTVVSSKMWEWIFNSSYGILNHALVGLGLLPGALNWLGTQGLAMAVIIFVDVWKTTPFMALLILAGLTGIPRDVYESAKIDGLSPTQAFFRITLPLLRPVLIVSMLLRSLDAFRVFDVVFIMTQGGPADSTEVLSSYTYKQLFNLTNFGYGSTLAMSIFFTILAIAIGFFIVMRHFEKKDAVR